MNSSENFRKILDFDEQISSNGKFTAPLNFFPWLSCSQSQNMCTPFPFSACPASNSSYEILLCLCFAAEGLPRHVGSVPAVLGAALSRLHLFPSAPPCPRASGLPAPAPGEPGQCPRHSGAVSASRLRTRCRRGPRLGLSCCPSPTSSPAPSPGQQGRKPHVVPQLAAQQGWQTPNKTVVASPRHRRLETIGGKL